MVFFVDGSIKEISETQDFGNFKKREFVIETDEKFPEIMKLEFINENVDVLDRFIIGEVVTIAFTCKGAEYQGKYFNNLRAVAICEHVDGRVEKELAKAKKDNKRIQKLMDELKQKK
jgi:hypothetical protein